ncbi:AraC family transcriptional regulator [Bradyrhizobium sp. GCM10027634]|uniref:AraC family transcriptional regulator n=1 Tax=unclassified Bradyrhizobium TaxID=2631580 RepID=UPI00263AA6C8|nr:AraC family transcriptional regulator [Bradyrhizobium sp. WYCCWR 12677]MDN5005470.1 AraC family transcriptional regulator [Bradyrhizobium sp. WYCCWR 12677]
MMKPVKVVAPVSSDPDSQTQSLVGLSALAAELAAEGVSVRSLFAHTGVTADQLEDMHARISHRQRLAIYRNAKRLARHPDIGLRAGARQRISDYGIYGYAMVSSRTFGDALMFALDHVAMAGAAVRQISFRIDGTTAILSSQGLDTLGDLLPFAAEFWRSSTTSLYDRILEAPFPTTRMMFPFPAPEHWRSYERMFNCPIDFSADTMEWHFNADVLDRPCPNANPITAKICQQVCEVVLAESPGESDLARKIRTACLNSSKRFPTASEIAGELGLSLRTLHRRLAEDGLSYQLILDSMRRSLATELLENTHMAVDQVAERVGFSDVFSFRKAFKKWTGRSPSDFRPQHPLS